MILFDRPVAQRGNVIRKVLPKGEIDAFYLHKCASLKPLCRIEDYSPNLHLCNYFLMDNIFVDLTSVLFITVHPMVLIDQITRVESYASFIVIVFQDGGEVHVTLDVREYAIFLSLFEFRSSRELQVIANFN